MRSVIASTEAKSKFSEILDRVCRGEEFVITRHDEMIAKLSPMKRVSRDEIRQAVNELREIRKGSRITLDEIIAWKNEGRR